MGLGRFHVSAGSSEGSPLPNDMYCYGLCACLQVLFKGFNFKMERSRAGSLDSALNPRGFLLITIYGMCEVGV